MGSRDRDSQSDPDVVADETADEHAPETDEETDEEPGVDDAVGEGAEGGPPASRRRWWLGLLVIPLLLVVAFAVDRSLHDGQALRGVTLAGRPIGGLDRAAIEAEVGQLEAELQAAALTVSLREKEFTLDPATLSFNLDRAAITDAALAAGRDQGFVSELGFWLSRWLSEHDAGADLAAYADIDPRRFEAELLRIEAEAIDDPPFEGAIAVVDGAAVAKPPKTGSAVDRERARDAVMAMLASPNRQLLTLPLTSKQPTRKREAVEVALERAEMLLSGPVVLTAPPGATGDPGAAGESDDGGDDEAEPEPLTFRFEVDTLAKALRSKLTPDGVAIELDPAALEEALAPVRAALEQPPTDARFEVSAKDVVSIVPSRKGRVIAADAVAEVLLTAGTSVSREGPLPIEIGAEAEVTTESLEALNIAGLVAKFTTRYACCKPRVKNIERIAELVDGVLLKPGERFSLNEHVGERRAANGFVPAPTIVRGEMKDTIGGGISQFATTFFNAAFHGGYAIIERQPHSYYFSRYPMGHEATLSFPKPDVIIENDTKSGLWIRTETTPTSVTVKLYGDNEGREVERKVSRPMDLTEPPIEYIGDPRLEPDERKTKVRGAHGWSVITTRIITFKDGTTKKETRKVTYKPRVKKVRVHPCMIPEGEDGHTGEPCPEPEEDDEDDDDGDGDGADDDAGGPEAVAEGEGLEDVDEGG